MQNLYEPEPPIGLALWTSRIAVFSAILLVLSLVLHRLFEMPTAIFLNLLMSGFVGAILSIVLAIVAGIVVWRRGGNGTARIFLGSVIAMVILAWPVSAVPTMMELPRINDVTTHPEIPPPFVQVARVRPSGANTTQYPGEAFAEVQKVAYPDLRPLIIRRSATETFDVVVEALRRLDMQIIREQSPGKTEQEAGFIEAVDRTLILGFRDDVAVRVYGSERAARIDVRSASRFGAHDFGRNAERVRRVLKEIVARLEATVSVPVEKKAVAPAPVAKKKVKKRKSRRRRKGRSRKRRRPRKQPGFF